MQQIYTMSDKERLEFAHQVCEYLNDKHNKIFLSLKSAMKRNKETARLSPQKIEGIT